ncbi:MAG: hypothetical protein V4488_11300 [Pseudomonadota bacterium]
MKRTLVGWGSVIIFLAGCAGQVDYMRPTQVKNFAKEKIVDKSRDAVWSSAVPELGKQFYVINNMDKASGLINVSYSGDPERYIDCGRIISYVKNVRGERTYDFPGSRGQQDYETMNNGHLILFNRKMALEGRINLVFEEISPNKTKITANTRYVINRTQFATAAGTNQSRTLNDSISFNGRSSAAFPPASDGRATECTSTGQLEKEILSVIN